MRKPIEDEIHDIIMRNIEAGITATVGTAPTPVPLNVKDIESMLAEVDKLPKLPDMRYMFMAKDGRIIPVEQVINLLEATEEDIKNVFRFHPELGIDLTGAELISFEMPKLNWSPPMFSMGVWGPTQEETNETT